MAVLDPRRYVDREAQQLLLRSMVAGEDEARVLVIRDSQGQGKTDLLHRMRVNCRESDAAAQVLMMDLRDLSSPFGLVERTAHEFTNVDAVAQVLAGFTAEYERRSNTFSVEVGGQVSNELTVNGAVESGGVATSVYIANAAPTGLQSQLAQNLVMKAFVDDLHSWHGAPLVLLIDHFNKTGATLRQWVDETLVRPTARGELSRVVIVLASTPEHAAAYDELAPAVRVTSLDRLHDDRELVRALLSAHGLLVGDDEDDGLTLDFAIRQLATGKSVLQIVHALASLALGADRAG
jgi:hypothetical protein